MKKIVLILFLSFILGLWGCATTKPTAQQAPEFLTAPVYTGCPALEEVEMPNVPIDNLSEEDRGDYEQISKAYAQSIAIYENYLNRTINIIDTCRSLETDQKENK